MTSYSHFLALISCCGVTAGKICDAQFVAISDLLELNRDLINVTLDFSRFVTTLQSIMSKRLDGHVLKWVLSKINDGMFFVSLRSLFMAVLFR